MIRLPIRSAARLGLDILYPPRCAGCGAFGAFLCAGCARAIVRTDDGAHCRRCEALVPSVTAARCPSCTTWEALDGATAACRLEGVARKLVHAYKYEFRSSLAATLAEAMAPLPEREAFDAAFAVPLHRSRERYRGFNQSAKLLEVLGWPAGPGKLERVRKTAQQVGQPLADRRRNVAAAFSYRGEPLYGLTVALVDDVVTTGVTAEECAKVLKANGAARVVAVAYARAGWQPGSSGAAITD